MHVAKEERVQQLTELGAEETAGLFDVIHVTVQQEQAQGGMYAQPSR